MAKLTLRVTKMAFYNGALVYPNEIIKNYEGDIPSWATLANGKDVEKHKTEEKSLDNVEQGNKKEEETPVNPDENKKDGLDNVEQGNKKEEETPVNPDENKKDGLDNVGQNDKKISDDEKTEEQLAAELDTLLTEAIEKGVIIEDADKKTVCEQIAELKTLLNKE